MASIQMSVGQVLKQHGRPAVTKSWFLRPLPPDERRDKWLARQVEKYDEELKAAKRARVGATWCCGSSS